MAGSQTHADQLHNQDRTNPVADDAVPLTEPQWTYQAGNAGSRYLNHIITCLLEGMLKSAHIHVKYDKIRKVTQEKDETPGLFLSRCTEAVQKYTNLDISTPARLLYLHVQFISQSAPDTHRKLHQLEKGPETPQRDLLEIAFKVFNNRRKKQKKEKEKERKAKCALFAAAIQEKNSTPLAHRPWPTCIGPNPPGPCFRCNQTGHWAKSCPNPRPPTTPCPTYKQWATGKWIVLRHYPPNLGVHPRSNSNGPGTRLRGALAPQTMAPQMR